MLSLTQIRHCLINFVVYITKSSFKQRLKINTHYYRDLVIANLLTLIEVVGVAISVVEYKKICKEY